MRKTASEHLHAFHKASHEDRTLAIANCQKALDQAAGMEPAGGPTTTFLKAEIARHETMQSHHADAMEQCQKAIAAADLEKSQRLVPNNVSAVTPDWPAGLRRVPRPGQPQDTSVKPNVPLEFEKMFAIEEGK